MKNFGKLALVLPVFILFWGCNSTIYDIEEMSMVVDDDCMSENVDKDTYKYLVLRENCKLYSHWETKASLIF